MGSKLPKNAPRSRRTSGRGSATAPAEVDAWRLDWPSSGEPKAWLLAMADKAAAVEGLDAYLTQMTMAVRLLDGQGFGADARALAAELLRRLEGVDLHGDKDASLHAHDLTEILLLLGQR